MANKTIRDYIMSEGLNGRYFLDKQAKKQPSVYSVERIIQFKKDHINTCLKVRYLNRPETAPEIFLANHIDDREATAEEVQRAQDKRTKESGKAQGLMSMGIQSLLG